MIKPLARGFFSAQAFSEREERQQGSARRAARRSQARVSKSIAYPVSMIFWSYVISGWLLGLLMLPMLARRYDASKAWAWFVILLTAPPIGLVLFMMLADNP